MSFSNHQKALLLIGLLFSSSLLIFQSWDMLFEDGEPILQGHDDTGYFLWLVSWVVDGDNNLANNLSDLNTISPDAKQEWIDSKSPTTGKVLNKYPVGWAVMNWPVYNLTHVIHSWVHEEPEGTEPIYLMAIWLFQLCIAIMSLFLAHRILIRYFSSESASWGLLVSWLASPLLYYQVARLGLIHNQAFFLTVFIVWLSLKLKDSSSYLLWIAIGFSSSMLVISRPTSIAYLIIPATYCFLRFFNNPKTEYKKLILAIAAAIPPISVQLLVWKDVYGSWFTFSYHGEPFYWLRPNLWGSWFSDRHGLFNWHPLLLLGALGWLYASFRRQLFPWTWIISFLTITYLNSTWWCWWFGSSFGNRAYEGSILFFMAGLAFLYEQTEGSAIRRKFLVNCSWIFIIWNAFLLSLYLAHRIDRSQAVSLTERLMGWF